MIYCLTTNMFFWKVDRDSLCEWATKWQLNFNAKKCKVLHLGTGNHEYTYTMGNGDLESVSQEKDLGVIVIYSGRPA